MRANGSEAAVRGMPEFKTRRATTPRLIAGFEAQLAGAEARYASVTSAPQRSTRRPPTVFTPPPRPPAPPPGAPTDPADLAAATADPAAVEPERSELIARARGLLNIPYVWGGNSTRGLDCSSYVSRVWGIPRQTTDTLHRYADPIDKRELRSGDAMNLPTWKDPKGYGHVRLFDRWADAARTKMWVYEETADTGRSVHRVIDYDDRYQPMRLKTLNRGAGW